MKVLQEVALWNGICLKQSGAAPNPSLPFPFQQSDADDICSHKGSDPWENVGKAPDYSNGWIPICCQGCTFFGMLVTAGEADFRPGTQRAGGGRSRSHARSPALAVPLDNSGHRARAICGKFKSKVWPCYHVWSLITSNSGV